MDGWLWIDGHGWMRWPWMDAMAMDGCDGHGWMRWPWIDAMAMDGYDGHGSMRWPWIDAMAMDAMAADTPSHRNLMNRLRMFLSHQRWHGMLYGILVIMSILPSSKNKACACLRIIGHDFIAYKHVKCLLAANKHVAYLRVDQRPLKAPNARKACPKDFSRFQNSRWIIVR